MISVRKGVICLTSRIKYTHFPRQQSSTAGKMRFLNQKEATDIDIELFNDYKFSVDQLMELAGLSCAHAIAKCYPVDTLKYPRVFVCCGPGNNGGDGLVCARHLTMMNYRPVIYYPKRTDKELYKNLTHQCEAVGIEILDYVPTVAKLESRIGLMVDALFGFSFKPPVRKEFEEVMDLMKKTSLPIASIDIPSGWDVEKGPPPDSIKPSLLISLTAPKLCARFYGGEFHYLGGRFVPPALQKKYQLNLPEYEGVDCVVKV